MLDPFLISPYRLVDAFLDQMTMARLTVMATDAKTTNTEYAHVVRTPDVVGGEPRLAGTRIRVRDVAAARDIGGLTPEEIATTVYPDLNLGQVYAALAYYEDHKSELEKAAVAEAGFIEKFLHDNPKLVRDARRAEPRE
jgi:uncharacterized protein (DUF433 family)